MVQTIIIGSSMKFRSPRLSILVVALDRMIRGKEETPDAYRYRVWIVALHVGIEKARSAKQMNVADCQIMVFSR